MTAVTNSLVIPVYRNRESIPSLLDTVEEIEQSISGGLETIFVIDGSPDDSRQRLLEGLRGRSLQVRIADHSRNFGSLAAVRTGLSMAEGENIAVMSADLQEPPSLIVEFLQRLAAGDAEVVAGQRASRNDRGDTMSKLYWRLYRRFVFHDIPASGVDVFACTSRVRDAICSLESTNTSLVAQLFWVGFRRQLVSYDRLPSPGPSGWTMRGKIRYLSDSVFAFSDLPVRILWTVGLAGLALGLLLGFLVLIARMTNAITVPGYSTTILVISFFGSLNMIGLGIVGSYVWRVYETVKGRPSAIVSDVVPPSKAGQ